MKDEIIIYEQRKYKIYVHVNRINNKKYVGITQQQIQKRWRNGNGYKKCIHFYNAIQKYGWDNFEHFIILDNLTKHEAMILEKVFILSLDSINNGYNITSGGEGNLGNYKYNESSMTGTIFGNLKIIGWDTEKSIINAERYWKCECLCKKHTILSVRQSHLFSGNTKSCGCINEFIKTVAINKTEKIDDNSIMMYFNNKPNLFCILDIDFYKKIKNIGWSIYKSNLIQGCLNGENISLYTLLFGEKLKSHARKNIYFINGNSLDLRKENIRILNNTLMPKTEYIISLFSPQSDYIYYSKGMKKWELNMKKVKNFKRTFYDSIYDAIVERNKYFNYPITKTDIKFSFI